MEGMYLGVHEAAVKLNVSPDTIRRWEKKGLVKSVRSKNNHRLFSIDELNRLNGKYLGLAESENRFKVLKNESKLGYTCVELFAGAGGTALGLDNAGIEHVLLNELDKNAVETLKSNRPDWNVVAGDVRELDFKGIKADIVQGGFPCQAFSYAGRKMGFEDTRGTLFFEFARAIKEIRPKIAIGENVKGLAMHDNGRTLSTMLAVLKELGYRVSTKILRAQYLDVPQKRERLIMIAIREDLNVPFFSFPKEKDYTVSLREALSNCPVSSGQEYSEYKKSIMDIVPEGGYWRDLPDDLQRKYMGASYFMGGGKTGMARRLAWDEPSLTLTCNPAQKQTERCHPSETRPLTVREYARLVMPSP
jgi:DNA (cytosine-5)-methyltransferase 1